MPAGGKEGVEADVPGVMHTVAQVLIPRCYLGEWTVGCVGDGKPEKDSQLPGHKVAATLLKDVRVRQE